MNHVLNITATNTPAVVERLLQVTRYRGYELAGLELTPRNDARSLSITLTVSSDKPIHLLTSQLHKLYDIQQLELAGAELAVLSA
ncbi:acetolactate synthase 2 small subunit [Rheinheimera hassiensis]|uniref:acetolactate synthase 2 small subunit n=1 Tax=Rheinheimera hassiensis TaxID=1193627 RepID=UPI001F06289B|nr:acetolactate synthase 2 small subunit [Rheinheimera hassiensis]